MTSLEGKEMQRNQDNDSDHKKVNEREQKKIKKIKKREQKKCAQAPNNR